MNCTFNNSPQNKGSNCDLIIKTIQPKTDCRIYWQECILCQLKYSGTTVILIYCWPQLHLSLHKFSERVSNYKTKTI